MANIKSRRKLSDLYKRGVEVRFGPDPENPDQTLEEIAPGGHGKFLDGDGKPLPLRADQIQVWVQPPSPLQREMAMRDAQASRAKSLVRGKREKDSEEHLTILAFLADMSDETLIEYVLVQEQESRRNDAIREVLAEDEWKDMDAYRDALRQYEEDDTPMEELEKDPEWVALQELDAKFGDQVAEREAQITDVAREALRMQLESARGNIERKAIAKRADMVSTQAFMAEYERQMLFYSIRDFDDNGVLFYGSAREMAGEDEKILTTYQAAMIPFITDSAEAKNLRGVVSGLDSSELPNDPETSEASIQEVASA